MRHGRPLYVFFTWLCDEAPHTPAEWFRASEHNNGIRDICSKKGRVDTRLYDISGESQAFGSLSRHSQGLTMPTFFTTPRPCGKLGTEIRTECAYVQPRRPPVATCRTRPNLRSVAHEGVHWRHPSLPSGELWPIDSATRPVRAAECSRTVSVSL